MKRYFIVLTSVLILAALLLGSCSTAAATTSSTTTTSSSSAASSLPATSSSAPATTYELKFTDMYTSTQTSGIVDEQLGKLVSEATKGRVKVTYFHSESLGKSVDFLKLLNGGVADIAAIQPPYYPNEFVMENGLGGPGVGFTSRQQRFDISTQLYKEGYFKGLANYKLITFLPTPPMNFYLKKKVTTMADFNGMKLRTLTSQVSDLITAFNATPVSLAFTDTYMSLDRGVIDGLVTAYEAFIPSKLYEVAKYALTDPIIIDSQFVIMSKDAWNKLPPDLQTTLDKVFLDFGANFLAGVKDPDSKWPDLLRAQGVDVSALSAAESAKLQTLAGPMKQNWITQATAKGYPAQAMMDRIDVLLKAK